MTPSMRRALLGFNRYIEHRMFLVVFIGMLLGLLFPSLSAWKPAVPFLFGYMTLVTALNISWREIAGAVRYPVPTVLAWTLLHLGMPLISLLLASFLLGSNSPFFVGSVMVMVIPVGVLSVIWTSISRGEPPLALTVVAVDSLLSPLVIPASLMVFLGQSVEFDARSLMVGLLWMIVVPTLVGISLHDSTGGRLGPALAPLNGPLSKICLILVVAVNIAAARDILLGIRSSILWLGILLTLQSSLGFLLGFGAGRVMGYSPERIRTLTFCVGLRNISAGIVIALRYFSPATAIPVVLTIVLQQPMAAFAQRIFLGNSSAATAAEDEFVSEP
jgi:predicted Na+-dependent transporter